MKIKQAMMPQRLQKKVHLSPKRGINKVHFIQIFVMCKTSTKIVTAVNTQESNCNMCMPAAYYSCLRIASDLLASQWKGLLILITSAVHHHNSYSSSSSSGAFPLVLSPFLHWQFVAGQYFHA